MSSSPSPEGIVEYFTGLIEYMRKLGYEDPRDKRIEQLEARLDAVAPVLQMAFQLAEIERWNDRFPKVFGAMSKALEQK